MRTTICTAALLLLTIPSLAEKFKTTTTLKDVQASGVKDKQHKHQAYDLSFDAQNKSYVCRTDSGKSMNATDFVVGSQVKVEVDGNNGKIDSQGKKVSCKVVRVEAAPPAQ